MRPSLTCFALFLCFVCLGCPAVAQQLDKNFHGKTLSWMREGDLAHIAWAVRYYRKPALTDFQRQLQLQQSSPSAENEQWLNTVARAFRLEGVARPTSQLSQKGLLWPITRWRGTMYEADGAQGEYDTHGTWDDWGP